jgi:small subunit ribosomal protein S16
LLRIRLTRVGRKGRPSYRIVVADHARAVKGKFLEVLGHYDALSKTYDCNTEKVMEWVKKGAQPTQTVARLLLSKGVKEMEKYLETMVMKPKKKEEVAA